MTGRVIQDRRIASRVITRLDCRCTYNGLSREAVVLDISLRGALLSSKFMIPADANVSIALKNPKSDDPLNLEGKVLRCASGQSGYGAVAKFSVRFHNAPTQLLALICSLK